MLLSVPLMSAADYERGSQQSRLLFQPMQTPLSSRVVCPFSELATSLGHHRALAGGSFNLLAMNRCCSCTATTKPGFSGWFFNFTATSCQESDFLAAKIEVPPAEARWCLEAISIVRRLAVKLKYHRLKPGGVDKEVVEAFCNCKIEPHMTEADGIPSLCHLPPNRTSIFSKVCEYAKKCDRKPIHTNPFR